MKLLLLCMLAIGLSFGQTPGSPPPPNPACIDFKQVNFKINCTHFGSCVGDQLVATACQEGMLFDDMNHQCRLPYTGDARTDCDMQMGLLQN